MNDSTKTAPRRLPIPKMEGVMARWYARQRASANQIEAVGRAARRLAEKLPAGVDILEVAPGPGYLAVELARLGFHVTGLDISHSFVQIARAHAKQQAVGVDFRQGDAASLPFDADRFDLIICQAAFKNFTRPVRALDEMHRVLRAGGTAVIQDMRKEATGADIRADVQRMGLNRSNAFFTRVALAGLRHRAFSQARFEALAAQSLFRTCEIDGDGLGMEVRLTKP